MVGSRPDIRGGRLMGLCPLHADHKPSFLVDPSRNLFYCYGCARGGDVIRFAELYHQVKFPQAVALLRQWRGVTPLLEEVTNFYRMQLSRHREAVSYLQQRGLHAPEVIDHMRIGYAPGRCLRAWLESTGLCAPSIASSRSGERRRLRHLCPPHRLSVGRQPLWPQYRRRGSPPFLPGRQRRLVCMGAGSSMRRRLFSWKDFSTTPCCGRPASITSPAYWAIIPTQGSFSNCATGPGLSILPSIPTPTEVVSPRRNGWRAAFGLRAFLLSMSFCRTDTTPTASSFRAAMRSSFSVSWRPLAHDIPGNPSAQRRRRTKSLPYCRDYRLAVRWSGSISFWIANASAASRIPRCAVTPWTCCTLFAGGPA